MSDPSVIEGLNEAAREPRQVHALRSQLEKVLARSEFYRRKWSGFGAAAQIDDLKSLADLERFPFTTKDELRLSQEERPPLGLHLGADPSEVIRISSTSGTTGRPLYYALSQADKVGVWQSWKNVFATTGLTSKDLTLFGLTMGGPYGAYYGAEALEWSGIPTIPAGSQVSTTRFVQLLQHLRPAALISITNFPLRLASELESLQIDPKSIGLKKLLVAGEPIAPVRQSIEKVWGAPVYDTMGIGEAGMLWAECACRDGMHFVAPEIVCIEYIDPITLERVSPSNGGSAEVVITHLRRDVCPLVRFRTHDIVTFKAVQCGCGRTSPRIAPIGRSDDMLKVRGVNIFPSAIENLLTKFGAPLTENFRVVLQGGERKFSRPLKLVVGVAAMPESGDAERLQSRLSEYMRDNLNVRTEISFVLSSVLGVALKGPMHRREYFVEDESPEA